MKLLFISLGCDKNLVDSEMMMGLLHDRGYDFTDNEEEADIIINSIHKVVTYLRSISPVWEKIQKGEVVD